MISNNVFTPNHTFPLSMWSDAPSYCNYCNCIINLYTTKGKILVNNFPLPVIHTVTFRGDLLKNFSFPPSFMPPSSFVITSSLSSSCLVILSSFLFLLLSLSFSFQLIPSLFLQDMALPSYSFLDTVPSERKLCKSDNNLHPQYAKYLLSHLM